MTVLRRLFEQRAALAPSGNPIPKRGAGRPTAGVHVDDESALSVSAFWRGVFMWGDLLGMIPFAAYRADDEGVARRMPRQPSLIANPSADPDVDAVTWREQVAVSLMLRGNAWGMKVLDARGDVVGIELLHPDAVSGRWDWAKRELTVRVGSAEVDRTRLWHLAINTVPGSPIGRSPLHAARQSLGIAVAGKDYVSNWYADGGHPSAVLESEQRLNPDQAQEAKDRFQESVRGGGVAVTGLGLKYRSIQVSPADAEFIATANLSGADIARFLKLPPSALGFDEGSSMTYANVESRRVDLLSFSVDPLLVKLESSLTDLLPRPQFVKATRDALLRTTTLDRYKAHSTALRDGWRSVDEVRRIEDLPALPDGQGDRYLWPPAASFYMGTDEGAAAQLEAQYGDTPDAAASVADAAAERADAHDAALAVHLEALRRPTEYEVVRDDEGHPVGIRAVSP